MYYGVPVVAQWLTNPTRNHGVAGSIPGLAQRVKDLALLWLWHRPEATAPIRPLAWEPPYAAGAAQEKAKRQKKKKFYLLLLVTCISSLFFVFYLFRAAPTANVCSQARGLMGAVAADLRQSHSNTRSELRRLRPTPQVTATPDP